MMLGSDQAKPLMFRGLFARESCYLASGPYFSNRNGRHESVSALEEYPNRPPRNRAMLCSKAQSLFTGSTNPSLPTRSTQTRSRDVST
jgi:hypothetical protein